MNKVLIIVGSQRKSSYNHRLGLKIKSLIENEVEVEFLDYHDLPFFNQDEEFTSQEITNRIRKKVDESDGLWFITPEYNGSYPGLLKNLIDWLSRPLVLNRYEDGTSIMGKKVTYCSVAGKSKGINAKDKIHDLLNFVGAEILNHPCVGIGLSKEDFINDELRIESNDEIALSKQAKAFVEYIKIKN